MRQPPADPAKRPPGALVWVHCPDPARSPAVAALARRLEEERDPLTLLLTAPARLRGAPRNLLQWPPLSDSRAATQDFLTRWKPDMLVWMRGPVQPSVLAETGRAGLPAIMVDAEAENVALAGGGWRPGARRAAFQGFERLLAANGTAAARLRRIGVEPARIEIAGRLDATRPLPTCHDRDRDDLARAIGSRPVWLVAGAVEAELDALAAAQRQASKRAHRLLMILAPAQDAAAQPMAAQLRQMGFVVAERLEGEEPDEATEIYVADGPGEIGLWYRLAPITLLGGTLSGGASRDPMEPAALGSAVLHGPQTAAHGPAFARLAAAGACRAVRGAADLGQAVEALLAPDRAAMLAKSAWEVATEGAEATNRTIDLIHHVLERS
ncbi:3-deoxy-D-manno-octulosonic acid transferase [Limimaricola variabilis]|uniref:3-deoxy-D-manno-octulosonic acid transferase n=1 Tax=Limimaricola variabilis TaxID=1492771 RepID=UPI00248334AE|nr:glycosyltransferase N-terminal domain-containing protein [Limimaricola variabilis]